MEKLCYIVAVGIMVILIAAVAYKKQAEKHFFEAIFWGSLWSFLIQTLVATGLSLVGYYGLIQLSILNLVINGGFFYALKTQGLRAFMGAVTVASKPKAQWWVALLVLGAALLYFLFPVNYFLGGRDPGLYLINGIHIARTGSFSYETDQFLNEHQEELEGVISPGYPGIYSDYEYGISENFGDVTPQFMPAFPAILAVGYDLAGLGGLIRVNGLIGLLCLGMLYYLMKSFLNRGATIIALIFMIINPAQLWCVRITQTEILAQLLLFLGVYLFARGWDEEKSNLGWISGLVIGIGTLNRIDTLIFGVGIGAMAIYVFLLKPKKNQYIIGHVIGYLLTSAGSLVVGWIYTKPYIIEHWNKAVLSQIIYLNLLCFALAAVVYIIRRFGYTREIKNYVITLAEKKYAVIVFCGILGLLALFAYCVRPSLNDSFAGRAMVEFSWYTSVTAIVFALVGLFIFLYRKARENERLFLMCFICMASIIGYIYRPSIANDHIWASRRWVTANIPFILIMAALALATLIQKKRGYRYLGACGLVMITAYLGKQDRPFIFSKVMDKVEDQYQTLAAEMDETSYYLTRSEHLGSMLRYVYDENVYCIPYVEEGDVDAEKLSHYLKTGKDVFWLGDYPILYGAELEPVSAGQISGAFLEGTVGTYPEKMITLEISRDIYRLSARADGRTDVATLNLSGYQLGNSVYDKEQGIVSDGQSGLILYGNYLHLEPGTYSYELYVKALNQQEVAGYVNVTSDVGETHLAQKTFNQEGKVVVNFTLIEPGEAVECVLYTENGTPIVCDKILLRKE